MNPKKIGEFLKELRKRNNLTQKDLADKYGVTYQAVSKWENGINLPEVSLLRQMSKDYNISLENILDGEHITNTSKKRYLMLALLLALFLIMTYAFFKKDDSFTFKTLSTSCSEFKVSGSVAFNKSKSSIYISNINYCGGDDKTVYKKIECNLYESNNNMNKKISSCKQNESNIKLEEYLKEIEINVDNYMQTCKYYDNNSLFLEINATDKNDKIKIYKIPLNVNNNCSK